jgi:hypothetical protein
MNWSKLPLKGSKEYKAMVSLTGLIIGLIWVAKDEMDNPKWTGIPKASELSVNDLSDWNKQFGPSDPHKWAISLGENERILKGMDGSKADPNQAIQTSQKKETW